MALSDHQFLPPLMTELPKGIDASPNTVHLEWIETNGL
jgi:hypothetical protein